jgi:putative DNA primase/helicase
MPTQDQSDRPAGSGAAKSPLPHPGRAKAEIDSATARPAKVKPRVESIPAELRALPRWVLWQLTRRKKRWTKVPINPKTGQAADSTDPSTWGALDDCRNAWRLQPNAFAGIGFVLGDGWAGVDLDEAIDPADSTLKPWAAEIVNRLSTYTDVSPSKTGVKMIAKGTKKGTDCKRPYHDGEVEFYDGGRFFTLTGYQWPGTPPTVEAPQAELDALYDLVFPPKAETAKRQQQAAGANGDGQAHQPGRTLGDGQLIRKAERAKNGAKFRALFHGDASGHGDDPSRADEALCCLLAFWTQDESQIDRIFRQSGLYRDKWDERRGQVTYGQRTIRQALDTVTEHYGDRRHAKNGHADADGSRPSSPGLPADSDVHLTDRGNAVRLVRLHGDDLRHCIPWKKWLVWADGRWRMDNTAYAKHVPQELYRWAQEEINRLGQEED